MVLWKRKGINEPNVCARAVGQSRSYLSLYWHQTH